VGVDDDSAYVPRPLLRTRLRRRVTDAVCTRDNHHSGHTTERRQDSLRGHRHAPLTHCFLHERADPCFLDGSQLLKRVGRRPHVTIVESRLVAEAEQAIPDLEFLCVLEEADHVAISRIRSEEHTSELQSPYDLVCRLLLEKKKT